jgi:hypothetical protein
MKPDGYMRDWMTGKNDIGAVASDTNAHAIAALLNRQPDDAADTCDAMLSLCAVHEGEFWHRLAGSIRKARGMV